jgi:hypothetical protein
VGAVTYTTVGAGGIIYAQTINDLIAYGPNKPTGRIRQGTAQTGLTSGANVAITFAAADEIDTHNFHDIAVNNTRVTPTVAGIYRVSGGVCVSGQTDYTQVQAFLAKNGTGIAPAHRITPGTTTQTLVLPVSAEIQCNGSSDYFEIYGSATRSGAGNWATAVSVQFASVLEWTWDRTEP